MNPASIKPELITFHSATTGGISYNLTSFRNVTGTERNVIMTVILSDKDARALRFDPSLATTDTTTVISLYQGAFQDIAGNDVEPNVDNRLEVDTYNRDISSPNLECFSLDINQVLLHYHLMTE